MAEPLLLTDVLSNLDARVPQLIAAQAKVQEATAKRQGKRAQFDPKFKGKAGVYSDSSYPRGVFDASAQVHTPLGADLQAGWRLGSGSFPSYDANKTDEQGELYFSAQIPLLDGLVNTEANTALQVSKSMLEASEFQQQNKLRVVRLKATEAWAKWAAAGAKLKVSEALVHQMSSRQEAMERQVVQGTLAQIDALDNLRALRERQAELHRAQLTVSNAAQALSLWYRDRRNQPIVVSLSELPTLTAAAPLDDVESAQQLAVDRADTRQMSAVVRAYSATAKRKKKALLPDLSLHLSGSQPLQTGTDASFYIGGKLEVSPLNRKARAERSEAQAALEQARQHHFQVEDAARSQVLATTSAATFRWRELQAATEAQALATQVANLEKRKFSLGAGDLFKLLSRESTALKAQKRQIEALAAYTIALANLTAAKGEGL